MLNKDIYRYLKSKHYNYNYRRILNGKKKKELINASIEGKI